MRALPVTQMFVDGVRRRVLVDSGCTKTVAHMSACSSWTRRTTCVTTVNGAEMRCIGVGTVRLQLHSGAEAFIEALVVRDRPLDFDMILGMDGITAFHGVTIRGPNDVQFGVENAQILAAAVKPRAETVIDENDFRVQYDRLSKKWTVDWKWSGGTEPGCLTNETTEYSMKPEVREQYEKEVRQWIAEGWLVPYNAEEHGPVKGTIPLMAVTQKNKNDKVRPVLDFRELNECLSPHTADADVCREKIREWRRRGSNITMIDLRKAYMQINVAQSLWAYQTVVFEDTRYVLRVLGFGLSIAPLVMKKVLSFILSQDERIARATSAYVDDICLDESQVPAADLLRHLGEHGLACKSPERVAEGARVLGIRVWGEHDGLYWRRDNDVPEMPQVLTRRAVFSICGQLTSHLPVCGWLRVAVSYLKRRATAVTNSWDEQITDESVSVMLTEVLQRVRASDPARGRWDVYGTCGRVWVDASSLAIGAVLEVDGRPVEDWCRLRKKRMLTYQSFGIGLSGTRREPGNRMGNEKCDVGNRL